MIEFTLWVIATLVVLGLFGMIGGDDVDSLDLPRNTSGWWNVDDYFEKNYKHAYEPIGLYKYLVKEYGKSKAIKIMKNEYGLVR